MIFHIAVCSPDSVLRSRVERQCLDYYARRDDACIIEQLDSPEALLARAADADMAVLPEMFCCLYQLERLRACAQPRGGEIWKHLRALACQAGVYLLGGSMPELDAQGRICLLYTSDAADE